MEGIQLRKKILLGVLLLTSIVLLLFFYSGLRSNKEELVMVDNRNYEINLYPTTQEGTLNLKDKLYYIVGGDIEKLYDSEGNPLTNYNVDLSKRPEVFYLEYQRLGFINERYKVNINYGDNYLALYVDGELVDNVPKSKIDSIEDLPNYTWFVDEEYTEKFNLEDLATQNSIGTRVLDEKVAVNYTINYLYENTDIKIEKLNSITEEGIVGDVVEITHPPILGYIPTPTSPTSYKLIKGINVVNVYYKVDKTQTFSYTINYLIKDTNTSLSPKLEGMHYVGNVELTHPTVLGYKLVSNQPNEIIIKAGVANNLNIYYEVDETQNNFPVEVTFKVTDPVTNQTKEVTKTLTGYVGEEIDINSLFETEEDLKGYKLADPTLNTVTVELSQETTYILETQVDKTVNTFKGKVHHQVEGELEPRHTDNVTGYIGEVINITNQVFIGYKVKDTQQPTKITILENNTAVETVYYVVDTQQTFPVTVIFNVTDPVTGVTTQVTTQVSGYIGEDVDVRDLFTTVPELVGYKLADTETPTVEIVLPTTTYTKNTQVDKLVNTYEGTVYYKVTGEATHRHQEVVTGYIGEEVLVPSHEINGYKVDTLNSPTVIKISKDGNAEVTVLYVVNQAVTTFKGKVHHHVEGESLPRHTDNLTGYIGEVIDITNQEFTGYKVKDTLQPTTITILENNSAVETVYYVVDTLQTFPVTVIFNVTDPVTGVTTQVTTQVSGYIGEDVDVRDLFTTVPELVGYKLADTETPTVEIVVPTTTYTKETQVDKTVNTYKGKVHHQVEGELEPRHTDNLTGYIGEVIDITNQEFTGYKVKDTLQPTKITILEDNTAVEVVYYVVDTLQNLPVDVIFNVTDPVTGITSQVTAQVSGYIGETVSVVDLFDTVPELIGYKLADTETPTLIIEYPQVTEHVKDTQIDQLVNTFVGTVYYKVTGEATHRHEEEVTGYIGEEVLVPSHEINGYKVDTLNSPTVIKISKDGNAEVTVLYVVDQAVTTFKGKVHHQVEGESLPRHTDNLTGYIGEVIDITNQLFTGYKVKDTLQPTTITILENNSAVEVVYYVVDTEQSIPVYVTFKVLDPIANTVIDITTTVSGYIGEDVDVTDLFNTVPELAGYKLADTETPTVKIEYPQVTTYIKETQVDITKTFEYTAYYYMRGTTNPVPNIAASETKSSYVGDTYTFTYPTAPLGYKLVNKSELSKEVIFENEAKSFIVYYEIDQEENFEILITFIRQDTNEEIVTGPDHGYLFEEILVSKYFNNPGYPKLLGYVAAAGEPTTVTISGTSGNTATIYCVVDETQVFAYTINYYLDGTTNPVPGISRNSDTQSGYIGQMKTFTYPTAPLGYKLVIDEASRDVVFTNKEVVTEVYY